MEQRLNVSTFYFNEDFSIPKWANVKTAVIGKQWLLTNADHIYINIENIYIYIYNHINFASKYTDIPVNARHVGSWQIVFALTIYFNWCVVLDWFESFTTPFEHYFSYTYRSRETWFYISIQPNGHYVQWRLLFNEKYMSTPLDLNNL